MQDPKFEKEVQKKLEELSFSPSEAVWTRVERAVNEKRRRRTPLFWFFLLPALGLAGAGMIYFSKHQAAPAVRVVRMAPASSTPGDKAAAITRTPPVAQATPGTAVQPIRPVTSGEQKASARTMPSQRPSFAGRAALRGITSSPETTTSPDKSGSSESIVHPGITSSPDKSASPDPAAHQDIAASSGLTAHRDVPHAGLPGLRPFDHGFAAPTASRLAGSSANPAASNPIRLKPKYAWEMGFAGGVGLSSLNTSLFQQPAVAATDVQALTSPTPVNASYKTPTSGVQPDISYWAGIVAQRPLSKALTLSLGLDLHYYSTRQQIGEAVYSNPASLYQASTFFSYQQSPSGNASQAAIYPYYSVGSTDVFVNRYYFLELPASLLWKVNHSRKLPLYWENGLSLGYLVSTSSIYYNARSGVFYKDEGSKANKVQLNLSTALLVGLPVKGMRLQAGPQVQYGLTSLQHQSTVGQHLFYGGLRIVLIPGKAKK